MKKVLPILLVVALSLPALANVTVTLEDAGSQLARINVAIDGGSVVRGMALKVTLTDAELAAVTDVINVNSALNAYIDFYAENDTYLDEMAGDETLLPGSTGDGLSMDAHPVADPDGPGVVPSLPATVFSISLGALDNLGAQGGLDASGIVCEIQLDIPADTTATVAVIEDPVRGGIVGDDLGTVSVSGGTVDGPESKCFNDNLGNLVEWQTFGEPSCWCYERNCEGDANGKSQGTVITGFAYVSTDDLNVLVAGWQVKETPKGPGIDTISYNGVPGICADFNRDAQGTAITGFARVSTNDLPILVGNWQVKESPKGPGVPLCPLATSGGEINFYTYPAP